jgi:hypothetical protein
MPWRQVASQDCWKARQRSSGGLAMLGDLGEVAVTLGASDLQLDNLAVLEVSQTEPASATDEDVQHRPAQAGNSSRRGSGR